MKTHPPLFSFHRGNRLWAGLGAMALLAMTTSHAQTLISVNFQGSNPVALAAGDSTGASPYAATNWNNVTGASGGPVVLNTSTGTASAVTLTSYTAGPFGAEGGNTANSTSQEILFGGGLNVNFGNASFTLGGLSAFSSYDLVVYYSGGTSFPGARHTEISASGTSSIFYASGIMSVYTAFTQSNSTSSDTFSPGNYVVFSGLTDPTQTVTMAWDNNSMGLIGFQISGSPAVPEPGTCALVALSGTFLVAVRRRPKSA